MSAQVHGYAIHPGPALMLAALALGGLGLLCRKGVLREAGRLTLSKPAFLVPAAMAVVFGALCVDEWFGNAATPNPFGVRGWRDVPYSGGILSGGRDAGNWILLGLTALTSAGHLGLVLAHLRGRPVDSAAFARGLRLFTLPLALGFTALYGGLYLVSVLMRPLGPGMVLCFLPHVLLAPLPAVLVRSQVRPAQALAETVRMALRSFRPLSRLLLTQVLFLGGMHYLWMRVHQWSSGAWTPPLVVSGTFSFNVFPFANAGRGTWLEWVLMATMATGSAVFLTAHVLAGQREYAPDPAPAADAAGDGAPAPGRGAARG
ncbi:MAG: hypothetical protein IT458_05120 [Planctomycetes bacterium]|nr:hypothetical protein [Planctomycetota bacterium]